MARPPSRMTPAQRARLAELAARNPRFAAAVHILSHGRLATARLWWHVRLDDRSEFDAGPRLGLSTIHYVVSEGAEFTWEDRWLVEAAWSIDGSLGAPDLPLAGVPYLSPATLQVFQEAVALASGRALAFVSPLA